MSHLSQWLLSAGREIVWQILMDIMRRAATFAGSRVTYCTHTHETSLWHIVRLFGVLNQACWWANNIFFHVSKQSTTKNVLPENCDQNLRKQLLTRRIRIYLLPSGVTHRHLNLDHWSKVAENRTWVCLGWDDQRKQHIPIGEFLRGTVKVGRNIWITKNIEF